MTEREAAMIVTTLTASYQQSFRGFTEPMLKAQVTVWHSLTKDFTYDQVNAALMAHMRISESHFAPVPAEIIKLISDQRHSGDQTAAEAWAQVSKAIRRSGYYSEEEFAKLPLAAQKAVGTAAQLKTWATDENYNEGVVQSHFLRNYKTAVERERTDEKLPDALKLAIANSADGGQKKIGN